MQQEKVQRAALLSMLLLHCAGVGSRSLSRTSETTLLAVASTPVLLPFLPLQSMPAGTNPKCCSLSRNTWRAEMPADGISLRDPQWGRRRAVRRHHRRACPVCGRHV